MKHPSFREQGGGKGGGGEGSRIGEEGKRESGKVRREETCLAGCSGVGVRQVGTQDEKMWRELAA